jgi:hypothetical protein
MNGISDKHKKERKKLHWQQRERQRTWQAMLHLAKLCCRYRCWRELHCPHL